MRKILLAVDASKGSDACVKACARIFSAAPPESVILLHVQQLGGGPTLMHDRMSDIVKAVVSKAEVPVLLAR